MLSFVIPLIYLIVLWYLVVLWLAFLSLEQSKLFLSLHLLWNEVSLAVPDMSNCPFIKASCMVVPCKLISKQSFRYWASSRITDLWVQGSEGRKLRTKRIGSDLSLGGRKGERRYRSFQHYWDVTRLIDGDGSWVPKIDSVCWRSGSAFSKQFKLGGSLTVGRKYRYCLQSLANVGYGLKTQAGWGVGEFCAAPLWASATVWRCEGQCLVISA